MEVACTRMNHHSSLLVDHHQLVVLIDHVDGYLLWLDGRLMARTIHHQGDLVTRAHLIVALHRFAIHLNETCIGSLLDAIAALISHLVGKILVDTNRILLGIHLYLPMLEEFFLIIGESCLIIEEFFFIIIYIVKLLHYSTISF